MSEHFTRLTVSAAAWCGKCGKQTQHRVDNGRLGPCIRCAERADREHEARKPAAKLPAQGSLFSEAT